MKLNKVILTGVIATTVMGGAIAGTATKDSLATINSTEDTTSIELAEVVEVKDIVEFGEEQKKKQVELTALPEEITEALKSEIYAGWKAEKAYKIEEDGKTLYEILVKKGEEQQSLFFNKKGIAIEKK